MSQANPYEQFILEQVNAARAAAGAQPLAFNGFLNDAAEAHSGWMLDSDTFSHTGAGGTDGGQRMTAAGYRFSGSWGWAENIGWVSTRAPAGLQDEAALIHTNLMNSPGHRTNILNPSYREVGIGFVTGDFQGWDAAMVTQNFAYSAGPAFLTGVAFDDLDGDHAYDVGEGLAGMTLSVTNAAGQVWSAVTASAGGYSLQLAAGSYTASFSAPSYASQTCAISIGSQNVKLDCIDPVVGTQPPPAPDPTPLNLTGTSGADVLVGSALDDVLRGLGGNDSLDGGAGRDSLDGGAGSDTMRGGAGDDMFYVDSTGDRVIEIAGEGSDTVTSTISYTLSGEVENLILAGTRSLAGMGNDAANHIVGNSGANVLAGLGGNDRLEGGAGKDSLDGGLGDDWVFGGADRDVLTGGGGSDRFVWESAADAGKGTTRDQILDFTQNEDRIDLSGIDAIAGSPGNDAFTFIGQSAFSGAAGELRYQIVDAKSDYTLIQGDVNGDRVADFEIEIVNRLVNIHSADVVL